MTGSSPFSTAGPRADDFVHTGPNATAERGRKTIIVALWIHVASILSPFPGNVAAVVGFVRSLTASVVSMPGVWMLSRGRGYSLLVTVVLLVLMWVPALSMAALLALIIIGAREPDRGSFAPR